jgi:hypothetical protein
MTKPTKKRLAFPGASTHVRGTPPNATVVPALVSAKAIRGRSRSGVELESVGIGIVKAEVAELVDAQR